LNYLFKICFTKTELIGLLKKIDYYYFVYSGMGFEVLYLAEPIDEHALHTLSRFQDKTLQNVAKEGLKLGREDKAETEKRVLAEKEFAALFAWLKDDVLKDKVRI